MNTAVTREWGIRVGETGARLQESTETTRVQSADASQGSMDRMIVRRAEPKDALVVAALFHSVYRDSSHPFQSTASVRSFLEDGRNFQVLAQIGNRVVASMAMTFSRWNDSYELGRAITVPDYRRNGLAGLLMQQVVDWVAAAGMGELIFGYPRVRRIAELCATLDPKTVVVGQDAARNVANGRRETHLIVCGIPRYARFKHVAPPAGEWLESRFLQEQIYAPLGLTVSPGRYPAQAFVGAASRNQMLSGAWLFDYCTGDPSASLDVIGRQAGPPTGDEICRELDECLFRFPEVQHVTATVLADKLGVIRTLAERGFEISAYLPAWYSENRCRYDCVQLVRRQYNDTPAPQDFSNVLAALQVEFENALARIRRSKNVHGTLLC